MRLQTKNMMIGYNKPKVEVAQNINIKIENKGLTAVIGVNGSGKSTLIKSLSRNLPIIKGEIILNNQPFDHYDQRETARLMSLVLTKQPIPQNFSVLDFVALGRHPYTNWLGMNAHSDKSKIVTALKLVELYDLKDKACNSLSDGQLQKVLIARAIAQDTPIIILDEPTSHLDMYHKALVLKLLKKVSQEHCKSIIFATHEINLALQLCDSIILINNKKVIQKSPDIMIKEGLLHSLFPDDSIIFDEQSRQFIMKA
jgi:iron complex transport system ATP-binding protein